MRSEREREGRNLLGRDARRLSSFVDICNERGRYAAMFFFFFSQGAQSSRFKLPLQSECSLKRNMGVLEGRKIQESARLLHSSL